jgi:CubicO group peptidase (beta-lactamase class C family)
MLVLVAELPTGALVSLPPQPSGVPWPTVAWPRGEPPGDVDIQALLDQAFDTNGPLDTTYAVVIVAGGRMVAERYGGHLTHFDRPDEPVGPTTPLLSWSMAKSMLQAVIGTLVQHGRLSLDQGSLAPEWSDPDDPRRAITVDCLLAMRDGLDFVEDYVDDAVSDVISMLFGKGKADTAHFAADRPLAASPGARFNYSSGTTNVLSGHVGRVLGGPEAYQEYLEDFFASIAMNSARPGFDDAGTWVASSYVHATAEDFARFGLLYLRDGWWDGRRILPAGWVDEARRPRSVDPTDGSLYGSHFWVERDDYGTFRCAGYGGQSITICPALDLVVVRMGNTPAEHYEDLAAWRAGVVGAFGAQAPS